MDGELGRYRSLIEQNASALQDYLSGATVQTEIFVPQSAADPVVVDVISRNPVPVAVRGLRATDEGRTLTVIADTNANGRRDEADGPLSEDLVLAVSMEPTDSDVTHYQPMRPVDVRRRFFVYGVAAGHVPVLEWDTRQVLTGTSAHITSRLFLNAAIDRLPAVR